MSPVHSTPHVPDPSGVFRRVASSDDVERITETVTLAFTGDPTWSPLLTPVAGELDAARSYWRLFTSSAQRYPWSFMNDEGTVASVWYPPQAEELTAEEEARFPEFVHEVFGQARATKLLETIERFDAAKPSGDYFYLSLLAVHPDRRGSGLGMQLLAENLRHFDTLGVATYLESSNPTNDTKYERAGYRRHGSIDLPSGLTLTTMWRDPGDASASTPSG
ncbi:MAG: GNAT family N-acetyltransferase [Leucobacter sp.]